MKKHLTILINIFSVLLFSCSKNTPGPGSQNPLPQFPQRYSAFTLCTTYNNNGTILSIGTPYSYAVTMEQSVKPGYNLHFLNFTGDVDTSVHAIGSAPGAFTIPSQNFTTSTGTLLQLVGQGTQTGDSLNYSWSFYMSYKTHDCICKSRKL